MSQAYRTFAEGREDLENGKFDRNTGCRKRFGEQTVLDHVSLSVTPGKIYGIIGRNGSGKTVLFKSICGFVLPDAGKILVRGKQVGKDVDIPQGIGIIIEHPGFLRDYSGFQNLKLLARLQKKSQMRR